MEDVNMPVSLEARLMKPGTMRTELTFHPFPQVQPPGGKELLLITTSKVFRKGDLYGGKQWRTEGDAWSAAQGAYVYVLRNLSDVIAWAELPDAVALVNDADARYCGNCADGVPGGPDNCSKCGRDAPQYSHWTPRTCGVATPDAWLYTRVEDGKKVLAFEPTPGSVGTWVPLFKAAAGVALPAKGDDRG